MELYLIQSIAACVGAAAFAGIFNLPKRYLPIAALAGFLSYSAWYLSYYHMAQNDFFANIIAGAAAQAFAEIAARLCKTPNTLFYISAIIPLVPGGALFRTLSAVVRADWSAARSFGVATLFTAAGIAVGITAVSAIVLLIRSARKKCLIGKQKT